MNIGLCAWSFTGAHREAGRAMDPHTPEGLTRLARDNGLHSVEFASQWLGDCSPEERAAFAETRADLDLFLDTGGDNYAADIALLRQAIETAHQTGARAVRTTVSRMVEGDRTEYGAEGMRDYIEALVQPFKEVMPLAEEYGIPVGIENPPGSVFLGIAVAMRKGRQSTTRRHHGRRQCLCSRRAPSSVCRADFADPSSTSTSRTTRSTPRPRATASSAAPSAMGSSIGRR